MLNCKPKCLLELRTKLENSNNRYPKDNISMPSGKHIRAMNTGVYIDCGYPLEKTIDCGYPLEPPRRSGSNVYPQPMI